MPEEMKVCPNCGRPLGERLEEKVEFDSARDRSTGLCGTYRIWSCRNPDCELNNTDLYREEITGYGK